MATLAVDGDDLWYDDTGDTARPIVFLHGAWSNADAWDQQWKAFGSEYRVIRMDLRGHGRTGPTEPRRYTVELFADDLEALVETLDLEAPILCGLSMGNIVIQEFLDRHPDRAAGAVLCGPARSMPPIELPAATKLFGPPPAMGTSLSLTGSKQTFRAMLRSIRAAHGGPWLAVDPDVREQAIEAAGEMATGEYRKVFRALYAYDPPTLSHVRTPTMAIYGRHESPLVKRQGRRAVDEVGDGPVVAVDDAAHLVNLDNPAGFNSAVNEFLTRYP
ncbi:MAG: alpha/beta fold hydrolase [Salinirussus sp.]